MTKQSSQARRAQNEARNARTRSHLMWQAGDGGGARYAAQQADRAAAAAYREAPAAAGPGEGRWTASEEAQFPFFDPTTGERYSSEWAMNRDRKIAADSNRVRRVLRRWIAGL